MDYKFNTLALHAGISTDETGSRGVPIHRTSAYLSRIPNMRPIYLH